MTINVVGANKRYGDFAALDDVSLEIPDGSLTALLGPSGSGKSTLLRSIAGLDRLDSGLVEINGVDVTHATPQQRDIGFVFQHYAVFKHMTVAKNVAFGLEIRKRPKAEIASRVDELLGIVGLDGFQHRYPAQLSGGQRQMASLAQALASGPSAGSRGEVMSATDGARWYAQHNDVAPGRGPVVERSGGVESTEKVLVTAADSLPAASWVRTTTERRPPVA